MWFTYTCTSAYAYTQSCFFYIYSFHSMLRYYSLQLQCSWPLYTLIAFHIIIAKETWTIHSEQGLPCLGNCVRVLLCATLTFQITENDFQLHYQNARPHRCLTGGNKIFHTLYCCLWLYKLATRKFTDIFGGTSVVSLNNDPQLRSHD